MFEDLIRGFILGDRADELDFPTLWKLSAGYVGDALHQRDGDTVWRVRCRGCWVYVLILLEFRSTSDPQIALRILEYTVLLYRELRRNRALGPDRRCPRVLPIVLCNGERQWEAAREVGELIAPVGRWLAPYQLSQRYHVLDERRIEDESAGGKLGIGVGAAEAEPDTGGLGASGGCAVGVAVGPA